MIQPLEKLYEGISLSGLVTGVMYFRVDRDGTITGLSLFADANITGADAVFNLKKNGVAQFSGGGRPKIVVGASSGSLSPLTIAVVKGDIIQIDLESGGFTSPLTCILDIEDGVSVGGGGSSWDRVTWGTKINTNASGTDTLTKSANGGSFRDGAFSTQEITDEGEVMYIPEVSVGGSTFIRGLGLKHTETLTDTYIPSQVPYLFHIETGFLQIWESFSVASSSVAVAVGDRLVYRVEKKESGGRQVSLWKNGARVYLWGTAPTMTLQAVGMIYTAGQVMGEVSLKLGKP